MRPFYIFFFIFFITTSYLWCSGTFSVPGNQRGFSSKGKKLFQLNLGRSSCKACHQNQNKFKRSSLKKKSAKLNSVIENCMSQHAGYPKEKITPSNIKALKLYLKKKYKFR